MTCLIFPFADASWQVLVGADAVDDVPRAPIVRAAFVAVAAASASRPPSASAHRRTNRFGLSIEFSPLSSVTARTYSDSFLSAIGVGEDVVMTRRRAKGMSLVAAATLATAHGPSSRRR